MDKAGEPEQADDGTMVFKVQQRHPSQTQNTSGPSVVALSGCLHVGLLLCAANLPCGTLVLCCSACTGNLERMKIEFTFPLQKDETEDAPASSSTDRGPGTLRGMKRESGFGIPAAQRAPKQAQPVPAE